jgi:hypothetical protein
MKSLTAKELRRLPASERDAILTAAAAQAEAEYRSNPELNVHQKSTSAFSNSTTANRSHTRKSSNGSAAG